MSAVCAASVILAVHGWERLQGRLSYIQLQEMKTAWHDRSGMPRDGDLNEGFKLGYRALEYEQGSADYRFMLASMHAWREKSLRLWPDQAAAETAKVVENLKAALSRRPSWYEAWILLALVKLQAGENDQQLMAALEKSIETGPYETSVQHGLAFIGPRVRDQLSPALREQLIEVMRISLDNPNINSFVVEQIVMTGMESAFEEQLNARADLARLRKRFLEKRNEAL